MRATLTLTPLAHFRIDVDLRFEIGITRVKFFELERSYRAVFEAREHHKAAMIELVGNDAITRENIHAIASNHDPSIGIVPTREGCNLVISGTRGVLEAVLDHETSQSLFHTIRAVFADIPNAHRVFKYGD